MATSKAVVKRGETAVVGIEDWAVSQVDPEDVAEVLEAVSGPEGFGPRDLPIIKIPSGGGQAWDIPTAEGRDAAKFFDAIILHQHGSRKCWDQPYGSGQSGPPACESFDGVTGYGNPGGACATCQFTRPKKNKDVITCPPRKNVFLLLPDMALPALLDLPLMSLTPFEDYIKQTLGAFLKLPWGVITRFELAGARAQGGEPYSKLVVSRVADIPKEQRAAIVAHRKAFVAQLEAARAVRMQVHKEITSGVAPGTAMPWDREPESGPVFDDDDDLPEAGDGALPPTDAQLDFLANLMREAGTPEAEIDARLEGVTTRREASEMIEELNP